MTSKSKFTTMLSHFEITEKMLADLLFQTMSFISGGSALRVWLENTHFETSDLDIFMRIPYTEATKYPNKTATYKCEYYPYEELCKDVFKKVLVDKCGYQIKPRRVPQISMTDYVHFLDDHRIKNIMEFNKNGKVIQLITIYDTTIEDFVNTFDFNISKLVIWGTDSSSLQFYNNLTINELEHIRCKRMFIHDLSNERKLQSRIKKYINRGFTLYDDEGIYNIRYTKEQLNDGQLICLDNYVVTHNGVKLRPEEPEPIKNTVKHNEVEEEPVKEEEPNHMVKIVENHNNEQSIVLLREAYLLLFNENILVPFMNHYKTNVHSDTLTIIKWTNILTTLYMNHKNTDHTFNNFYDFYDKLVKLVSKSKIHITLSPI